MLACRKILLSLFLILCFASYGWAATYYMRADGTAANLAAAIGPASNAANCMSLATYDAEAAGSFSPGDIIKIKGGDYDCTSIHLTVKISGTSGNPITYENVAGETPIFDAHQTRAQCFYSTGKSYITVRGITFKNAVTRQLIFRSETASVSNFIIDDCTFTGNGGGAGITLYPEGAYNVSDVTISNCTFDTLDDHGIYLFMATADGSGIGHTITVENCTFNSIIDAVTQALGYCTGYSNAANALAASRFPYGITIQNNTFSYISSSAIRIYCTDTAANLIANNIISYAGYGHNYPVNAIQTHACKGLTIEYNDVSYTETAGPGDGCGIILDWANTDPTYITEDCIVRYNRSHHNTDTTGGATPSGINTYRGKNNEIYYNICDNNYRGINQNFDAANSSVGNVYYNNTITNNSEDGVEIYAGGPTSTWKNNIFANNGGYGFADYGAVDADVTYSCFYNNTTANHIGFTPGVGCIETDPQIISIATDNFKIGPGSPCINTGTSVALTQDYRGRSVPKNNTPDIGAYESIKSLQLSSGKLQPVYAP